MQPLEYGCLDSVFWEALQQIGRQNGAPITGLSVRFPALYDWIWNPIRKCSPRKGVLGLLDTFQRRAQELSICAELLRAGKARAVHCQDTEVGWCFVHHGEHSLGVVVTMTYADMWGRFPYLCWEASQLLKAMASLAGKSPSWVQIQVGALELSRSDLEVAVNAAQCGPQTTEKQRATFASYASWGDFAERIELLRKLGVPPSNPAEPTFIPTRLQGALHEWAEILLESKLLDPRLRENEEA